MVVREGDHEAHPCASPFGQQSCAKRLSCRFVETCRGFSPLSPEFYAKKKSERKFRLFFKYGGERGVRTLDTLPYTHFPGVLLQPLGHLTIFLLLRPRGATGRYYRQSQGSGQAEFSLLLSAYPQSIHSFIKKVHRNQVIKLTSTQHKNVMVVSQTGSLKCLAKLTHGALSL